MRCERWVLLHRCVSLAALGVVPFILTTGKFVFRQLLFFHFLQGFFFCCTKPPSGWLARSLGSRSCQTSPPVKWWALRLSAWLVLCKVTCVCRGFPAVEFHPLWLGGCSRAVSCDSRDFGLLTRSSGPPGDAAPTPSRNSARPSGGQKFFFSVPKSYLETLFFSGWVKKS